MNILHGSSFLTLGSLGLKNEGDVINFLKLLLTITRDVTVFKKHVNIRFSALKIMKNLIYNIAYKQQENTQSKSFVNFDSEYENDKNYGYNYVDQQFAQTFNCKLDQYIQNSNLISVGQMSHGTIQQMIALVDEFIVPNLWNLAKCDDLFNFIDIKNSI